MKDEKQNSLQQLFAKKSDEATENSTRDSRVDDRYSKPQREDTILSSDEFSIEKDSIEYRPKRHFENGTRSGGRRSDSGFNNDRNRSRGNYGSHDENKSQHDGFRSRDGFRSHDSHDSFNRDVDNDNKSRGSFDRGGERDNQHNDYNRRDDYKPREGGYNRDNDNQRFGDKREGGYKSRDGYKPREGGYNRDGDNRSGDRREGGYKSRDGYKPREGGYNRDGDNRSGDRREGGYKSRDGYKPREGGYNRDGDNRSGDRRDGGYKSHDGYKPREGGYNRDGDNRSGDRRDGGYKSHDGYKPREGGYNRDGDNRFGDRREGGYKSRDGYKKPFNKNRSSKDNDHTPQKPDDGTIRLNKYISDAGYCSRREADNLITSGSVMVNGVIINVLGTKINKTDKVQIGEETLHNEKLKYLLLNKPKGYITTMDDPQKRNTVLQLVDSACRERLFPVGRLDRNTSGLLLFTNDGELANRLMHPKGNVSKVYHVVLDKALTKADFDSIANGLDLEDGYIAVDSIAYVESSDKKEVGVEIHSGRNQIVRRIFSHLGYEVVKLDRTLYAGLTKKDLPRGRWRFLTDQEINFLKML